MKPDTEDKIISVVLLLILISLSILVYYKIEEQNNNIDNSYKKCMESETEEIFINSLNNLTEHTSPNFNKYMTRIKYNIENGVWDLTESKDHLSYRFSRHDDVQNDSLYALILIILIIFLFMSIIYLWYAFDN